MRWLVTVITLLSLGAAGAPRRVAAQDVRVEAPITDSAADTSRAARIQRAVNLRAALLVVDDELRHGLITPDEAARARAF